MASFIVHEDVARGDPVPVLPAHVIRPRDLYSIYPQNRHPSPKVLAFIDFTAKVCRQPNWS